MSKYKMIVAAIISGIMVVHPGSSAAQESFKSSDFLKHPAESQRGYISSSVMMAALIATQNNRSQASCLDEWGAKYREDGFAPVLEAMRRFPDYHPSAVVISVLQKACGSFSY
jgi:hypothetical protein